MANFCGACGSPLGENSTFCGACGARVQSAETTVVAAPFSSYPPVTPEVAAPVSNYQPVTPLPAARTGMSPVIKIVLVVVVLLVLVGTVAMAGLYYVFHLAARKAHQISEQVRNGAVVASLPADDAAPAILGPGDCRLISKEDVGRAIGIAIVSTKTTANGCEYLAQGTTGEMTSKHVAAMMASNGANDQQQKMMQSLSKGLFGGGPPADGSNPNADVNAVVLGFTITPNSSDTPLTGTRLPAVGEQAAVTAGSIMSVRKGSKLIRITYSTCPCTTTAIVPLAKRLAASQ